MTTRRSLTLLVAMVFLAIAAFIAPGFSSATFTAKTSHALSAVAAATDWVAPTVTVTSPGTAVQGNVTVQASASDAGSGVREVTIQVKPAALSSWTTLCVDTSAPFSCSWNTASAADGSWDLRAIAVDTAANTATSSTVSTVVNNTATITLARPAPVVRGSIPLQASVAGIGSLAHTATIQVRAGSTGVWTAACANLASPYSCSWNSSSVASGTYELRAVLTAGPLSFTSAAVSTVVDNTAPVVTMSDPGTSLSGVRTFAATASDAHSSVAKVEIQSSNNNGSSWTSLCTITSAPWSCSVNTATTLANGTYAFRAIATDAVGNVATSPAVANRSVTNAPPRGHDVQAFNGRTSTLGLVDAGDSVEFTYSTVVNLDTILAGWNGSAVAVEARFDDAGFGSSDDTMIVRRGNTTLPLGELNLRGNYFLWLATCLYDATMTATTVEDSSGPRTKITIVLGERTSGLGIWPLSISGSPTMEWTPSSAVKDLLGQAVATTKTLESGTADRDF